MLLELFTSTLSKINLFPWQNGLFLVLCCSLFQCISLMVLLGNQLILVTQWGLFFNEKRMTLLVWALLFLQGVEIIATLSGKIISTP